MVLIEGVADDVLTALFALFVLVILIVAWLSTNVRDYNLTTNLLIIERRSRRLYTTNSLNGNLNLSSHRLSQSPTTTTTTVPVSTTTTVDSSTGSLLITNQVPSTTSDPNTSNVELTEMVEQALVDNLFENDFFSTHHHHPTNLLNDRDIQSGGSSDTNGFNIGVTSGHGNASSQMSPSGRGLNDSTVSSSSLLNESSIEVDPSSNSQNSSASSVPSPSSNELINILVRFVNEKEMRIQAKPNDTIHFLKKTYFNQELSNNKIVRFIYQGQFLSDKNTIQFYNIKDKTTIHCHITTKQTASSSSNSALGTQSSDVNTNEVRHRVVVDSPTTTPSTSPVDSATGEASNMQPSSSGQQQQQQSQQANATPSSAQQPSSSGHFRAIISIDLNSLLLPLFAVVLSTFWYFRIHFKHFFSPLSTLILVIFTFLYALFLTNNIHATSTLIANNFWLRSQLFLRSQQQTVFCGEWLLKRTGARGSVAKERENERRDKN